MAASNSTVDKELKPIDKINEASLLLSRAISINELLFELSNSTGADITDGMLSGSTDAINSMLESAKDLIESIGQSDVINVS